MQAEQLAQRHGRMCCDQYFRYARARSAAATDGGDAADTGADLQCSGRLTLPLQ
jgi:hypothetical protein